MPHTTVRVRKSTHARIRELAERHGESMQSIIEQAIELLERRSFLDGVNLAYADLRQDDAAWTAIREEQAEWDVALGDGLDPEDAGGEERADDHRSTSDRAAHE